MVDDARLDPAIHAPTRLRLCALLRPIDFADFATIASTLGLSDANLSKTIRNLVEVGYLATAKNPSAARDDQRRLTVVSLTPAGRVAVDRHLAALRDLVSAAMATH